MPRPSTSILRMPSASRSSLSHSTKVRSSIAALPIGTTSSSRLRVMTKPPTCCERWRGKPTISRASAAICRTRRLCGSRPARDAHRPLPPPPPQIEDDSAPMVSSRQAERLADLADGRAAAIADHGGGDAGALAPVFAVDVLDHLLAPLVLEIDVDVGRLAPLRRDEALEQQIGALGIDLGDAEAEAHGGIGRRAAALAQDALRAREAHDVVDGEEIGRVVAAGRSAPVRARCSARTLSGTPCGIALRRARISEMRQRVLRIGEAFHLSRRDIRSAVRRARR